jgi:hypothetical protein
MLIPNCEDHIHCQITQPSQCLLSNPANWLTPVQTKSHSPFRFTIKISYDCLTCDNLCAYLLGTTPTPLLRADLSYLSNAVEARLPSSMLHDAADIGQSNRFYILLARNTRHGGVQQNIFAV